MLKKILKKILPESMIKAIRKSKRDAEIRRERKLPEAEYERYLTKLYHKKTGETLNLKNPVKYTEKQQWLKLYDQSPQKTKLVDKYLVRQYISEICGKDVLIPIIAIDGKDCWTDAFEIDFEKLPNQFVLKCNHGSGYNIIVKDKLILTQKDIRKIKQQLNVWLKENFAYICGLELQYRDIKPLIYIERYMAINDDLPDYKFMCFSGKVKYCWVDKGRYTHHRRTVYNLDYQPMPFQLHTYERLLMDERPDNFDKMIQIAEKLCGDWKYVRVDLYNVEGKIYFGEMTFSSGGGFEMAYPKEYNELIGEEIKLGVKLKEAES